MSNHQKRLSAPTSWPVERKTSTFTVKADAGPHGEDGVPLLILLRDVLGYVDTRSEANYALSHDSVLVNGKPVSDEERPIGMFDILAFTARGEFYRVFPDEGGRLALTAIDEDAAGSKLGKIVGKAQVPGGDTQLTLHDGATLLVDDESEYAANDSIVVDNDDGSIVAHFPYEEGGLVTVVDGRHAGEIGTVSEIQITPGSSANTVSVETDGGAFETIEEYVVVIDENFTADDAGEEAPAEADAAMADEPDVDASEAAKEEDEAEIEAEDAEEADVEEDLDDESEDVEESDEEDLGDESEDVEESDEEDLDDESEDVEESDEEDLDDESEDVEEADVEEDLDDESEDAEESDEEDDAEESEVTEETDEEDDAEEAESDDDEAGGDDE